MLDKTTVLLACVSRMWNKTNARHRLEVPYYVCQNKFTIF